MKRKRTRTRAMSVGAICIGLLCAIPTPGHATGDASSSSSSEIDERVAAMKQRGDDALISGRPADALAAYDEAYALKPDPALLFNRGRAYMALGDFPAALEQLDQFDKTASPELRAKVPGLEKLLREVHAKVSEVLVACDVDGATVRLGDHTIGTTPLRGAARVKAGSQTIEITKDGYFPYKIVLPLQGGLVATVDAHLASKTTQSILSVSSPVVGAHVSIDGKDEGTVPTEVIVSSGEHAIVLTREGYKAGSSSIVINAGEHRDASIDLQREASLFTSWWFWTAVGVVVIGTTISVIALTTEKDPGSGNLTPGRISAGLHF